MANDMVQEGRVEKGMTGLALMTPIIGFPIFFHALSGMVVAGIGVTAFNNVLVPFAGKVVEFTQETLPQLLPPIPIPIPMPTLTSSKATPIEVPFIMKVKEVSEIEVQK